MQFKELPLQGAYLIDPDVHHDQRGFFSRSFCRDEFARHGIHFQVAQSNLSYSRQLHTLRGMHFQKGKAAEKKLVKCLRGKILDVIIDLRAGSPTFCEHFKIELSEENHLMLLVPEGFAHGFLTLEADCQVFYQVNNYYDPENEAAVRWNDPIFSIQWPVTNPLLSGRDAGLPDFKPK